MPRAGRIAAWGAIALGSVLRLLAYAENRPLWTDELMLATSVAWRSFAGLARPLEYDQTAPLGFLWVERLAVSLGGADELSLRALPLVCGIATLPLLWITGRRLLGERAALTALLLATLSTPLIYYASEVKQYASDVLVTAGLLYAATSMLRSPERPSAWRRLAAAGSVAVFFSQTSVFMLAAVGVAACASRRVRATTRWLARLSLAAALWAACFLPLFATVYRSTATSAYMRQIWQDTFLTPRAPDLGARLYFAAECVLVQSVLPTWPEPPRALVAAAVAAFLAGVAVLWRRDERGAAALITLPVLFVVVASAIEQYPIGMRVLLFLSPATFLTYGAALSAAVRHVPARARDAAFAAALACFAWWREEPVRRTAVEPRRYEDTRDVIADYRHRESRDPVYVYADAAPSWAFYTTDWQAPDTARLAWLVRRRNRPGDDSTRAVGNHGDDPLELVGREPGMEWRERRGMLQQQPAPGWAEHEADRVRELARRGPSGRQVWVYFSHFGGVERDDVMTALRLAGARVVFAHTGDTVALYLVRFDPPA